MQIAILETSTLSLQTTKVKRLAPSFGGGARFVPEKYKQSIVKIYTFLYFKKRAVQSYLWIALIY